MSIFSNPAARSPAAATAYARAVLELVGDREPPSILGELVPEIERLIRGLDRAALVRPEAPGRWSIAEVLAHLADSEVVWAWRLRRVLAEDRPLLTGFDQDAWSRRLRYREVDPSASLELLHALRTANLRLLRDLEPADLDRTALHEERGEESLSHLLRLFAGHDLVHRRQLARIHRATVGSAGEGGGESL